MNISVVVKRDNKWYIGWVDGKQFHVTDTIKKLSDVKDLSGYVTLKKHIKDRGLDPSKEKDLLTMFGFQSVYVLNRPINPSAEEFEAYWWETLNKKCIQCIKECKQSSKVVVEYCPDFEGEGEEQIVG